MINTKISGIPCTINVIRIIGKYVPAKTNAPPEHCYEAEYPDIDWEVCDQRGKPAPWLQKKLTGDDSVRIENEIMKEYRA